MDLPLDNLETLAAYGLQLRPIVVRSLLGAGYRSLGDLCWASDYELRKLFYIGRTTAREIRAVIRRLQIPVPAKSGGGNGSNGESAA